MNRREYFAQLLKKKPYKGDVNSIKFIGVETYYYDAPSASNLCAKPADTIDGDVLIAIVYTANNLLATPPSGTWIQINGYDYTSFRVRTYWKIATSEPPYYNFTFEVAIKNRVTISTFRNVDTSNVILGYATYGRANGNAQISGSSPLRNAMMFFFAQQNSSNSVSWIRPAGMNKVFDANDIASCTVAIKLLKNGNGLGALSIPSNGTDANICGIITLKPKY